MLGIGTNSAKTRHASSRQRATGSSASRPSSGSPQARTVSVRDGDSPARALAIVVAAVDNVSVVVAAAVPETVTDAGAKLHVAYWGKPVQEKFTVPPNPAAPVTLTCVVTDWPDATVSVVEPPLPGPTATGASTVC